MNCSINYYGFDAFNWFTGLAILFFCFSVAFVYHRKSNIPLHAIMVFVSVLAFSIIFGAKVCTISSADWLKLFKEGALPGTDRMTIMGALVFGLAGFLLAKKILGIRQSILDEMAPFVLLSMCIQRLGCLLAGCCFGIPTESNFGLKYGFGTIAHAEHFFSGAIKDCHSLTVNIHPVPLYLMAWCLISIGILNLPFVKFKRSGNRLLFAILLFIFGRFFIEFYRDGGTNLEMGKIVYGLKYMQYLLLVMNVLLAIIIIVRERRATAPEKNLPYAVHEMKINLLFITHIALTYMLFDWFIPLERSLLFFITATGTIVLLIEYCKKYAGSYYFTLKCCAMLILLFVVFPVTAQISLNNSGNEKVKYSEVSISGTYSTFEHFHTPAVAHQYTSQGGCSGSKSGVYYTYPNNVEHANVGLFIHYGKTFNYGGFKRLYYRVGIGGGYEDTNSNDKHDTHGTEKMPLYLGVTGSVGGDSKLVGMEAGIYMGEIRHTDNLTGDKPFSLTAGKPEFGALPKLSFRFGYLPVLALEAHGGLLPGYINGARYPIALSLKTGFGFDNGMFLRTGGGVASGKNFFHLGLCIPVNNSYAFEANAYIYDSPYVGFTFKKFFKVKNF
jgi:phosphatidylglycerol:prolipoprotein diacylglycerol transferase